MVKHDLLSIYFVLYSLPVRTKFSGVEAAAGVQAPQARAQEKADSEEHERGSEQVGEPVHHVLPHIARTLKGQQREDPLSPDGSYRHEAISNIGLLIGEEAQDRV